MPDTTTQDPPAGGGPSTAKFGWPKTPDGTIDWEAVFEAPDTGLIVQLVNVNTHDLLFKVTETIIRQLFTRKGDEAEVDAFLHELTRIIVAADQESASVESTRDSVIDLLRRIKKGRIGKAAAYAAEQKRKAALGRKRRRIERRDADRKVALKARVMLMGCGGIAAALILAGVVFVLSSGLDGAGKVTEAKGAATMSDPAKTADSAHTAAEGDTTDGKPEPPAAVALRFTPDGYPLGTLRNNDLLALGEHVMTLPPILFSRNVGAGNSRQAFILPVLSLRDPESWSDICKWAPSLTEAISGVMLHQIPATGTVSPSQFRGVGEVAMQMINQRLGGVLVSDMFLLYDVEHALIDAGARCRAITYG